MRIKMDKKRIYEAFSSNKAYFERIHKWHMAHGGVAVEPEMKNLILSNFSICFGACT